MMTQAEMTMLEIAGLREGLEIARDAIKLILPFVEEDFPNGPDGDSCATQKYREAYKALLGALGTDQPAGDA